MASSVGASDGLSEARQKFMMRLWWQAFKVRDQQRKRAMHTETGIGISISIGTSASTGSHCGELRSAICDF